MTAPLSTDRVSGLSKLGNHKGEAWVTLRESEAAAVCAELSKLHTEHMQDVERMERAAEAIEQLTASRGEYMDICEKLSADLADKDKYYEQFHLTPKNREERLSDPVG